VFEPEPEIKPVRLPRQLPKRVVPSYIDDSGQVGNWLFYKGTGDTLYDYSQKENHGDINGAKWTDKEQAGWALDFDGTDDYICLGDIYTIGTGSITFTAWIKTTQTTRGEITYSHEYGGYDNRFTLEINQAYENVLEVETQDGSYSFRVHSTTEVNNGSWYFVAGVLNRGSNLLKAYVDGVEEDTADISSLGSVDNEMWPFGRYDQDTVCGDDIGVGGYFDGIMDSIHIHKQALSDDKIKKIYTDEKAMFK